MSLAWIRPGADVGVQTATCRFIGVVLEVSLDLVTLAAAPQCVPTANVVPINVPRAGSAGVLDEMLVCLVSVPMGHLAEPLGEFWTSAIRLASVPLAVLQRAHFNAEAGTSTAVDDAVAPIGRAVMANGGHGAASAAPPTAEVVNVTTVVRQMEMNVQRMFNEQKAEIATLRLEVRGQSPGRAGSEQEAQARMKPATGSSRSFLRERLLLW